MTKKKIVVFTTSYLPFIGGAEIAVREVARRLCDSYDVYIITARQNRMYSRREIAPEGIIIRLGFGTMLDKWLLPFVGFFELLKLGMGGHIPKPWKRISKNSLLLWGMDISQGSLSAYLCKLFFPALPFIFTVQYGDGDARLADARLGVIGMAFRRILRACDAVTAISSYLFSVAGEYGYAGIGQIIPNGVDTSLFAFQPPHAIVTDSNHNQRVIITTSRLVKKNGVDVLIRAVGEVKKTTASITCYIIGDGPERTALENLVNDLQLSRDIIFLGSVPYEEIPFYLRKADVFVRPSRSEGMGNSFIEALSVGIPIIGTPVGGIPDIIKDGETGILCRVDDAKDVAEKILMLFGNDKLVMRMRKNGRHLVEQTFSWDAIARSYAQLFEKLLHVQTRVLICTPLYSPEIGGPATYSKMLVDGILDRGILVRVVRFSSVRGLPKILRHIAYAWHVCLQSRYADSIYAQDPVSVGFGSAIAALITRKKFVMKIVGDYAWEQGVQRFGVSELLDDFLERSYGPPVELLRAIERFSARQASHIVVPSEYLKTVVVRWGIPEGKITVIANSFEIPLSIISYEDARLMLGLRDHVVVSAGRLVKWKGFGTLVSVIADLIKKNISVFLFIIGSGPLEKELRDAIIALDAEAHIRLIGQVGHNEMLTYLAAADTFVLNTGYEGFSHMLLEAMAMGTPVITTAVGGNRELITDKQNGFLVEYNNNDQLSQAIVSVLDMPTQEREHMTARARQTACYFTHERMLRETAEFIMGI